MPGDPNISGITTPDDQTLVFKLVSPPGAVIGALALPLTVPVPEEYAKKFDTKNPSTYDQHVAFVGPYMIAHDASGKLTGRKPGKSITIVRNPNWDKGDRLPPGVPGPDRDPRGQRRPDGRDAPDPERLGARQR